MIESPGLIWTILSFLAVIGPLIFVHELGHYFAGRAFGVKAEAFSIGFGRELFGWTDRRGTRWRVAALPLGGYVRFAGDMNPASAHTPTPEWLALPPEERAQTFQAKPLWQRFIIVAAGPIVNLGVAAAIFAGVFTLYGEPRTPPVVASVAEGSAAARAGLKAGDRLLTIGGREVEYFSDIQRVVSIRPAETLMIRLLRDGRTLETRATTGVDVLRDRFGNEARIGLLGVASGPPVIQKLAAWEVPGVAVRHVRDAIGMMIDTLGQIVTGQRSVKELGGPAKIAQVAGQQTSLGWLDAILFVAMISINLGFINLLPIPLLDGGHLLFYLIEAVRRRPLGAQVQEWAFRTGLAVLLSFMIFVTVNDLGSFGLWERLAGLIG